MPVDAGVAVSGAAVLHQMPATVAFQDFYPPRQVGAVTQLLTGVMAALNLPRHRRGEVGRRYRGRAATQFIQQALAQSHGVCRCHQIGRAHV